MRDLTPLFDPASVAVVGASANPAKWGYFVSQELLSLPSGRGIHLVNRAGGEILGHPVRRSLAEVPGGVDLVAICVPAAGFVDAVRDALRAGAKAIVAITSGLGEADGEGAARERVATDLVRAAGAVLIGPNCMGIVDNTTGLRLSSDPLRPGDVTILSQSGNMVIDLDDLLGAAGLGIARFVSLGNQADTAVTELMRDCVHHAGTRAVAVYAEDLRDGRDFVEAARELRRAGKPVVLLAPGASEAGRRGAASHTGSLTSADSVIDAACAAGGIHRVHSPVQMVDALVALRQPLRARGRRMVVLTDGGGHGAVAADCLHRERLDVPSLSPALGAQLTAALWEQAGVANPVDLAGVGEQDPGSYARGLETLLRSDEVDGVLVTGYFGGYAATHSALMTPEVEAAQRITDIVRHAGKPVVVHSIYPDSASTRVLRSGGIPVHRDIGRACLALSALVDTDDRPLQDDMGIPTSSDPAGAADYETVREVLRQGGLVFPAAVVVRSEDVVGQSGEGLSRLLDEAGIGFPLALKAMGLLHKSDSGGVILDLQDAAQARAALGDLASRLAPERVCVEEMVDASDAVEVIVGCTWDPRFGPVLMVGLGGLLAEILDDVTFALAPVTPDTARTLLGSLRGSGLLQGFRGRPAVDLEALVAAVVAVGDVAARHPEWAELEVNPLIASARGVVAVDARAVMAR